jgi:ATP-dependent RNA helicase DDX1
VWARQDGVHHSNFNPNNANEESLSEGVKRLKPLIMVELIEKHQMDQAIVFVRTQLDCDNLEQFLLSYAIQASRLFLLAVLLLSCTECRRVRYGGGRKFTGKVEKGKENPFSCVVLHGGRQHAERKRNLAAFKARLEHCRCSKESSNDMLVPQDGDVRFLICTDVAARGLDIAGLPYCINLTLPDKPEDYIHRIGRVGRADTMGLAISLVATEREKVWFYDKR